VRLQIVLEILIALWYDMGMLFPQRSIVMSDFILGVIDKAIQEGAQ